MLSNEKSLSFDDYAYALIALSLDSGDWKEIDQGLILLPPMKKEVLNTWLIIVILSIIGVYLWRKS